MKQKFPLVSDDVFPSLSRLKKIMTILLPLFPDTRPLLSFKNSFELLIATVLAAQCTDAGVNRVTPELFRRFPGPAALADAPLFDLETVIHRLGFFRVKSRAIKALSAELCLRYNGEVPGTMEELVGLPGVGRKTASVVLSVCFGVPAIIVDTHFSRVARRLGLTASDRPGTIERDIAAIADKDEWISVSGVLNRFGRAVCHAKKPECGTCPLGELCPSR